MNTCSIDIETSSDKKDGSILSIGVVDLATRTDFYTIVHTPSAIFSPAAMLVNGLTWEELNDERNPDLAELDRKLFRFLKQDILAMGRGISYFDMSFISKDLPMSFSRFNRRLFDLNGFMHGLDGASGLSFERIRMMAMTYAAERCKERFRAAGEEMKPHHALYDAWENVYVLEFLKTL